MKSITVLILSLFLTGCAAIAPINAQSVEARASIHAAALAHARETIREAQDWRALATEADAVMTPNQ